MGFIRAGDNNEIQMKAASNNDKMNPENAGVGRLSVENEFSGSSWLQKGFKSLD